MSLPLRPLNPWPQEKGIVQPAVATRSEKLHVTTSQTHTLLEI